jgi:hypothetical protein
MQREIGGGLWDRLQYGQSKLKPSEGKVGIEQKIEKAI